MRRARVIIKLETGLNREEILTADNLCVSISGQRERLVRMRPGKAVQGLLPVQARGTALVLERDEHP